MSEVSFGREKDIRIIKHKKESAFTTLYNDCINDERLSANALSVLVYVMSKPDDWKVMVSDLRRRFSIGRNKCYSIISELCSLGYMQRVQERLENGAFQGCLLQTSDKPIFINTDNKQQDPEIQEVASNISPHTGNRDTGNRDTGNQEAALYIQNKDLLQKKETTQTHTRVRAREFLNEFEQFWSISPKKVDKQKSLQIFNKLLSEDYGNFEKIMAARRAQNVVIEFYGTEQRFIKGPDSWLRNRRFEDEVLTQEQLHEQRNRSIQAEASSPSRMSKADLQFNINAQFREQSERRERDLRAKLADLVSRRGGDISQYLEGTSNPFDF